MKKYLREKHSTSAANKVKKANLMRMYNKCSDFCCTTELLPGMLLKLCLPCHPVN